MDQYPELTAEPVIQPIGELSDYLLSQHEVSTIRLAITVTQPLWWPQDQNRPQYKALYAWVCSHQSSHETPTFILPLSEDQYQLVSRVLHKAAVHYFEAYPAGSVLGSNMLDTHDHIQLLHH
jgi:hypothetical protein